ncbi:hypothetical protein EYC80_006414 [Monilinia laxa]|uniref:Core Histone H2A/H2B/H3 domain-containing protein n=1 Tax=Monilinia laxa TaxID=61186 RepID=A0A5N6JUR9_MONLA|nr:hypothetical protein EYC80_006414 [Monilinia laxa]
MVPRRMTARQAVSGPSTRSTVKTRKVPKTKVKRRWRPGTVALREIQRYQQSTDLIIPKAPFHRLVREIIEDISPSFRIQRLALNALQEVAEAALVTEFEMTNLCAIHAKRVTIQVKDMALVRNLRRIMLGVSYVGGH